MKFKIIRTLDLSLKKARNDYLPPLGMPSLYAHIKDLNFDITQTDLNTGRIQKQIKDTTRTDILKICSNKDSLSHYLKGYSNNLYSNFTQNYLNIANETLEQVDVLMISIPAGDYCSILLAVLIARYFKNKSKKKVVVFGGLLGEDMESILKDFDIYSKLGIVDYYMLCADLESSLKLVRKINGEPVAFNEIHGLIYRENNRCIQIKYRREAMLARTDFTGIPLQDYAWDDAQFFHRIMPDKFPDEKLVMLPFRMILGCPYRCAFCFSSLGNQGVSYLDPIEAVSRLRVLSENHQTKYFFFLHDMINISEKFINDFCDEIIRTNLKIFWTDCASVRNFRSPEIFVKLKKAGCCRLLFGMETASRRLLKFVNKRIIPQQIQQVIKWSHAAGIWTGLMLIAGFPYETNKDIQETIHFIQKNAKYIDTVTLSPFHLVPNSLMFAHPEQYGITNVRRFEKQSIKSNDKTFSLMDWAFDEINGLSWEKKLHQIKRSYQVLRKVIAAVGLIPESQVIEAMSVLFYLYTHINDKNMIKKFYSIYCNRRMNTVDACAYRSAKSSNLSNYR